MLKLVLVDDNVADAKMLQTAMRQTGVPVEIHVLQDGMAAVEYLTQNNDAQYDLVLLDLNLPKLGGLEVLERIRACHKLKALPVIVMSGSSDPSDVDRCYRSGANSYICKPTHLDDILETTSRLISYWGGCVTLPSRSPMARGPRSENLSDSKPETLLAGQARQAR